MLHDHRPMSSRAFTLVELLVVIGVVIVLIALLLPALGRARAAAQRVQCLSNMRQLSVATFVYAQNNHGWLPPTKQRNANLNEYWDTHQFQYLDFGTQGGIAGLGHLYTRGMITQGQLYFCPTQTVENLTLAHYSPWVTPAPHSNLGAVVRIGYFFNPHTTDRNRNRTNNVPQIRVHQRLAQVKPGRVLMVETFQSHATTAHRNPTGWNVIYTDGSGRFVTTSRQLWDMVATSHLTSAATARFSGRNWIDFNRGLDMLCQ